MDELSIGLAQLAERDDGLLLSVAVPVYFGSTWVGSVLAGRTWVVLFFLFIPKLRYYIISLLRYFYQ